MFPSTCSSTQARIQGGCFGGCSTQGYESQKRKKERKGKKEIEEKKKGKKQKRRKETNKNETKKEREWFVISNKMMLIGKE